MPGSIVLRARLYRTATDFGAFVDELSKLDPQPLTSMAGDGVVTMQARTRLSSLAVRYDTGFNSGKED